MGRIIAAGQTFLGIDVSTAKVYCIPLAPQSCSMAGMISLLFLAMLFIWLCAGQASSQQAPVVRILWGEGGGMGLAACR
jgi:hypothetical protein